MTLIERLSQATGPDRELDAKLALVNGAWAAGVDEGVPWVQWAKNTAVEINDELPRYTGSIDAAVLLLPEGCEWKCGYSKHVPHNAEVADLMRPGRGVFIGESDWSRAIALCIAAVRARSHGEQDRGSNRSER